MRSIGIMQGRLLPPPEGRFQCFPRDNWQDEFAAAAAAGLNCIEWIYDVYGEDANPLETTSGIAQICSLSADHRVAIHSICADWFMDHPLVGDSEGMGNVGLDRMRWLIDRANRASIRRIVLPFVDASGIQPRQIPVAADILSTLSSDLRSAGVEMDLETDLSPSDFASLLNALPADVFRVNYDTGNSASLGFDPDAEFEAYGPRIGSIHVKDRTRGGGTVPLGQGHANLEKVFGHIIRTDYSGQLILQVARSTPGAELRWAISNRQFVEKLLAKAERES